MSATGTNALCSWQGLGSPPQCASGIAAFFHSTARFVRWLAQIDVLGQHPILLHSATRTACLFRNSTASRACRILPPTSQLEMMPTSVTATAFGPQHPFLFRHLTNMPHSMKMRPSCRNIAASPRSSCAVGRSTRPSRTGRPAPDVRKCLPCTGRRFSMLSPASEGRHGPLNPPAGYARRRGLSLRADQEEVPSILTICMALVLPPHSRMAGGAAQICMDVVVLPVPSPIPKVLQLPRRGTAGLKMQISQASTATGRRCRSSVFVIGTSSTRMVITSTPARSTRAARRMPTRRSWMRCRRYVMTRACQRNATTYRR
jgi:hypothetical protein